MIRPILDRLPGPGWLKSIVFLAALAAGAWALCAYAFPVIDPILFPVENPTVGP